MRKINKNLLFGLQRDHSIQKSITGFISTLRSRTAIRTISRLAVTALNKIRKNKIITPLLVLDLETRKLSNSKLQVISGCIYNGVEYDTFYLTDYISEEVLLAQIANTLVLPKYNKHYLYVHNLSGFDGVLLFKYILNLTKEGYQVKFIQRKTQLIKIEISGSVRDNFSLTIYDSLLLLPFSLAKLAKSFGVGGKLDFNVLNNDSADLEDPNFKEKLLEYNRQDCKALYDVMMEFNKNTYKLFKIEIFGIPTLSSFAFKLFKTKFLHKKNEINIT
jgi:hypothetical protein